MKELNEQITEILAKHDPDSWISKWGTPEDEYFGLAEILVEKLPVTASTDQIETVLLETLKQSGSNMSQWCTERAARVKLAAIDIQALYANSQ